MKELIDMQNQYPATFRAFGLDACIAKLWLIVERNAKLEVVLSAARRVEMDATLTGSNMVVEPHLIEDLGMTIITADEKDE